MIALTRNFALAATVAAAPLMSGVAEAQYYQPRPYYQRPNYDYGYGQRPSYGYNGGGGSPFGGFGGGFGGGSTGGAIIGGIARSQQREQPQQYYEGRPRRHAPPGYRYGE